ncbi:nuclear transport factor 2 family protein [Nocardia sp. NPDC057030]|uniref:nuclear transport factor 2 family protein n=1 Tax=unclassified Nocardia TaxID=2637762 RepID=UPI0036254C5A
MTQDNKTIVQNAWKAFAGHDFDEIAACFTEDAEWLAPPQNATAAFFDGPSHMVGRAVIADFLAYGFQKLFAENVALTFRGFYAEGDRVIVEETMSATLVNGNHYENDYCFVFELRDGLIHRVREYMDTARGHRMIFG